MHSFLFVSLLSSFAIVVQGWSPATLDRRLFLTTTATALVASPPGAVVDVGGGFDLKSPPPLTYPDVPYPISMEGPWKCTRQVVSSEGDSFQSEQAWKLLGGNGPFRQAESFSTQFQRSDVVDSTKFVVLDRGYELASRKSVSPSSVVWDPNRPNDLQYDDKMKITVVQRTTEPPSDQGFGFNELYKIDNGLVTFAVQVKRRYRRAYDENNNRVVEGLEIMKTYRVLDGVAGTEMPTSTTKSTLRLTRQ